MFTDEDIEKVMSETGVSPGDYFIRRSAASNMVAKATELSIIDSGLNLLIVGSGQEFVVTLDVEGVRLATDVLDIQFLEWAGVLGVGAVRGVLTVVEREGRALRDRLMARFSVKPF